MTFSPEVAYISKTKTNQMVPFPIHSPKYEQNRKLNFSQPFGTREKSGSPGRKMWHGISCISPPIRKKWKETQFLNGTVVEIWKNKTKIKNLYFLPTCRTKSFLPWIKLWRTLFANLPFVTNIENRFFIFLIWDFTFFNFAK